MALPTPKAAGTFTTGSSAITPPYPVSPNQPVAGDIAILVVESENQAISLSAAQGFVELGAQANKAAGTAGVDPASRLAVYWKRCVGGDTAPTVAAPGNHATAQIYLFSGCIASGDPWNVYAEGNDGGANDLTGVIPGATTTVADCLIFLISTSSYNGTSTAEFTGWTNGALGSLTERGDNTHTIGLGGGHGSATGTKAVAGAYGNTTVTLAHTSYKGAMSIALKPPPQVDVEVFPTGPALTSICGDIAVIISVAIILAGQVLTSAQKEPTITGSAAVFPTGQILVVSQKEPTVVGIVDVFPTGQILVVSQKEPTVVGIVDVFPTGQILVVSQKEPTITGSAAVFPTGQILVVSQKEPTTTGSTVVILIGQVLTSGLKEPTVDIEAPASAGVLMGGATLYQKPQVSRKLQVVTGLVTGSGGDGIVWPSWGTTGGGVDVEVFPTGQILVVSQKEPTIAGSAAVFPTGQILVVSQKEPTVVGGAVVAPTGQVLTSGLKEPMVVGGASVSLVGQSISAEYGTIGVSGNAGVLLISVQSVISLGDPIVSTFGGGSVEVILSGIAIISNVSPPSITGEANVVLVGQYSDSSVGNLTIACSYEQLLVGISLVTVNGNFSIVGGANILIVGQSGQLFIGSLSIEANGEVSIVGLSSVVFDGSLNIHCGAVVGAFGQELKSDTGILDASIGENAFIDIVGQGLCVSIRSVFIVSHEPNLPKRLVIVSGSDVHLVRKTKISFVE